MPHHCPVDFCNSFFILKNAYSKGMRPAAKPFLLDLHIKPLYHAVIHAYGDLVLSDHAWYAYCIIFKLGYVICIPMDRFVAVSAVYGGTAFGTSDRLGLKTKRPLAGIGGATVMAAAAAALWGGGATSPSPSSCMVGHSLNAALRDMGCDAAMDPSARGREGATSSDPAKPLDLPLTACALGGRSGG